MGGKALLGALLLASLCLAQPRQLKQSLSDLETLVNAYVPPDARPALYSAASAVINSVPGAAAVVNNAGRGGGGGSSSGGSSGSSGTQNGGQGVFCTTCGPSGPAPAGSAKAPASGNTPAASSGSGSGGSRPTFDTSSAAQG